MAGTIARCKSITNDEKEYKNPLSASPLYDDELVEKVYSDSTLPVYYLGKIVRGITFTCADKDVIEDFGLGEEIEGPLVVVMEGVIDSEGTLTDEEAITITLTNGVVTEAPSIESTTDGAPMEYTVTVMCANLQNGNDGTLTIT